MRLYVKDKQTNKKIYLNYIANSRHDFVRYLKRENFTIKGIPYVVSDIFAESTTHSYLVGAIIGGILGLMMSSSIAIIVCSLIGMCAGADFDSDEMSRVNSFNNS